MAFFESVQRIMTQDHPRARSLTAEAVAEMNLEKSLAFYRDRFGDAGDFTFFLVGNIDLEAMKPLVKQYLAALPSDGRNETWRDLGIRPPKGVVKETVYKGMEPKSITVLAFTGPFRYDPLQRLILRALCSILDTRLRNAIREDRGGTYGVNINPSYNRIPIESYGITINFGTDPERVEELTGAVFDEIARMKADGPTEEEVQNIKEAEIRSLETDSKKNAWWLSQLAHRYQSGEDPAGLLKIKDLTQELTAEEIQAAARSYFDLENYIQVTLRPEKK
jgi:zinc protease